MTREQFVKLLAETVGLPVDGGKAYAAFTDVRPSSWSAPYIAAAVDAGVIVPAEFGGSAFLPGQVLTRAEMAVWTARALGLQPNGQARAFADPAAIRADRGRLGGGAGAASGRAGGGRGAVFPRPRPPAS
ncbi:S-layer homology domain-containing protein [uncultured Paenibacillus sp.]|uniref:S-layer homology domain-containing protein n=1 Tax=uncultured Paenibacillus sp. TaxID=227322 RepID=UPI0028D7E980|nr:S-layer homology domain-containing protein [uncultured Paenibacillus sp.]